MQAQKVAMAPTDSHTPTSRKAVRAAFLIHQRKTRRDTPFKEIKEEVQAGQDRVTHENPDPVTQTPATSV